MQCRIVLRHGRKHGRYDGGCVILIESAHQLKTGQLFAVFAIGCQNLLGRVLLAHHVSRVDGIGPELRIQEVPGQYAGLLFPKGRQVVIVIMAEGCLTMTDKINHTHAYRITREGVSVKHLLSDRSLFNLHFFSF